MSLLPSLTPGGLGARLRAGDAVALNSLVRGLGDQVFGLARRLGRAADSAAELTLATFVSVWRQHPQAPTKDADLVAWVYGHAVRAIDDGVPQDRLAHELATGAGLDERQVAGALGVRVRTARELLAAPRGPEPGPPASEQVMPAGLPERIALAVADEPEAFNPRGGRARGPLLVALLAVAVIAGAVLIPRSDLLGRRTQLTPTMAASTAALLEMCRKANTEGGAPVMSKDFAVVVLHDGSGAVRLCYPSGPTAAAGVTISPPTPPRGRQGSVAVAVGTYGDMTLVVAGGRMPANTDTVTVPMMSAQASTDEGPPQPQVYGTYWLWSGLFSRTELDQDDPSKTFFFDSVHDDTHPLGWLVAWPGTATHADPTLAAHLQDACVAASSSDVDSVTSAATSVASLVMPDKSAALAVSSSGAVALCTQGSLSTEGVRGRRAATADGTIQSTFRDTHSVAQTVALGGRVPAGTTSVQVEGLNGGTAGVVRQGWWVWGERIDNRAWGLHPDHLRMRMNGSRPVTFSVPWGDPMPMVTDYLQPSTGRALALACAGVGGPSGTVAVTTPSGRVAVLANNQVCVHPTTGASIQTFAPGPGTIEVHVITSIPETPATWLVAGGDLPPGVTGVRFSVPGANGPVPAVTIKGRRWAWEFLRSPAQKLDHVTVTITTASGSYSQDIAVQ